MQSSQLSIPETVLRMGEREVRRASMASAQKAVRFGQPEKGLVFGHKTRLIVLAITTMALTVCVSNGLIFNFTVICMDERVTAEVNGTNVTEIRMFYTETERSWLISLVAVGTILGTVPVTFLVGRIGIRNTFTIYGLSSVVSVAVLPLSVGMGFWAVAFVRVVQGVAITASWCFFGAVIAEWAELKRTGTVVAYLSCHLQLGPMLTMPISGALCDSSWGWQSTYYLHSTVTLIIFIMFYLFYRDSPATHPFVSSKELKVIQEGKVVRIQEYNEPPVIPYRAILTDKASIGAILSALSNMIAFRLFFQYGPIYLNEILGFDVRGTGFASALPFLLSMLGKLVAGPVSDTLPGLTDKQRVIAFASVSQFLLAGAYFGLAFLPTGAQGLGQFYYTAVIALSGLDTVSVLKSIQLFSGRYVNVLMSINSMNESIMLLGMAFAVSLFVPTNSEDEWSRVFIFMAVMMTVFTIVFDLTTEVTPRPWAQGKTSGQVHPAEAPVFELRADDLANLEKVERVLHDRRVSIQSHQSQAPSVGDKRHSILSFNRPLR